MAKKTEPDAGLLESRAWELFAKAAVVGGTATVSHDHLARECFQAAAEFASVANERNAQPESKG